VDLHPQSHPEDLACVTGSLSSTIHPVMWAIVFDFKLLNAIKLRSVLSS
jgi:hypothetical protein